jgi:hypothetical protein
VQPLRRAKKISMTSNVLPLHFAPTLRSLLNKQATLSE